MEEGTQTQVAGQAEESMRAPDIWKSKDIGCKSRHLKGNRFVAGLVQLDSDAHLLEVVLKGEVRGEGSAGMGWWKHQWAASTAQCVKGGGAKRSCYFGKTDAGICSLGLSLIVIQW